jgi:hypothetical protein
MGYLTLLVSGPAIAQTRDFAVASTSAFSVGVERDELAVSCPDSSWFQARIASHIGKAAPAGDFAITLTKRAEAWHAKIERWGKDRSLSPAWRMLDDRSSACAPLAEAAALTVAILATDAAERGDGAEPAGEPPLPPPHSHPVVTQKSETQPQQTGSKVWVGVGGGAAISWISPVAPVLGFGAAFDALHLREQVRLMLTTEQKFELAPGRVFVQAWLATFLSCARFRAEAFGAALCGAADVGMLRASAEGFDEGKPSTRSYEAVGLELHPSWYISDSYRVSAALGALLPLRRESFSVVDRGVAYIPPSVNWRILVFSEIGVF